MALGYLLFLLLPVVFALVFWVVIGADDARTHFKSCPTCRRH